MSGAHILGVVLGDFRKTYSSGGLFNDALKDRAYKSSGIVSIPTWIYVGSRSEYIGTFPDVPQLRLID